MRPMSFEVVLLSDMSRANIWSRPVAPYRIATELRAHGFPTLVINGVSDYGEEELIQTLETKIGPETLLLGLSSTFLYSASGKGFIPGLRTNKLIDLKKVLSSIKSRFPWIKFAVGGANTSLFMDSLGPLIDYYVFGYADSTIVELAQHIKSGNPIRTKMDLGSHVIHTDNEANSVGISQYQTRYQDHDEIFDNETLVLEISRGCRFKCRFCSYPMNGREKNTFFKSAENLREELLRNFERYNVTNYILADDTYNESIEKLEYFKKVFQSLPFKINFATYLRLDLIHQHPESIDLLLESGLGGAFFGIESLYGPAARAIGKGVSPIHLMETLQRLRTHWGTQVHTTANFIVGLPEETPRTVADWLNQILEDDFPIDHASVNPLYIGKSHRHEPWPSDFQTNPQKFGYQLNEEKSDVGRGVFWVNQHFDSSTTKKIVDDYYATYFKTFRSYDSFNIQALKGYDLHKTLKVPQINNPEHRQIIDAEVELRAQRYKHKIAAHRS